MKETRLDDWNRILFGDGSPLFLFEVVARTLLLYLLLLLAMRLMGRRVAAQLSRSELAVILTLGAAIGLPIQAADSGMLWAFIILLVGIGFQRGLAAASLRWRQVEHVSQGAVRIVLREGRLDLAALRSMQMSTDKLMMALRAEGIQHLGELRRVYIESAGGLSLVRYETPRAGLSILVSENEPDGVAAVHEAERGGARVCAACGGAAKAERACDSCPDGALAPAVLARAAG